ncbi:MAG TPA: HD domain-containing protein [Stenotrophomonas sp.]|jgi:hypothetical protein
MYPYPHALAPAFALPPSDIQHLAGVQLPDTPVVERAICFARATHEPWLFNHVLRSWLFATLLGQQEKLEYDAEVLAVITLLHDLGLAEVFEGPLRFEVEGANAARDFAHGAGLDPRRCQLVWDGVALNSTPSIARYKEVEVSLSQRGVGVDWGGWEHESIPAARMAAIMSEYPRLEMKRCFSHAVCGIAQSRPQTTYDNFARDFGERFVPGYHAPSSVDALMGAPFTE